nr:hypothetical protein [Pantoea sp. BAV 3049]
MQHRLKDIAALDQKCVAQLERDVPTGERSVQYADSCSATTAPASTGVDDAASPGSDDAFKRKGIQYRLAKHL